MSRIILGLSLVAMLLISGCAQIAQAPVPDAYPLTTQQRMQAMHHWEVLAEDVAAKVETTLAGRLVAQQWPIYVAPSGTTPFERAFQSLLVTHLVKRNMIVTNRPTEAVVLSFDLEAVRHSERIMHVRDRVYMRLAPDVYVYRTGFPLYQDGRPWAWADGRRRLYGPDGVYHHYWYDGVHGPWHEMHQPSWYSFRLPSTEIMVTSTLMYGEDYIMRDAAIYYVNETDAWHYQHALTPEPPRSVIYQLTDR
ncbi:hypothetical protein [Thiorhodospira sibirica]|uniref:hypothetical protein n=1 Tax=Thiorhodospira sibirica TaxID=154347 RepID=UPI00022C04A1|nr:hypothetical protein [Thiorhodospira sibirica]